MLPAEQVSSTESQESAVKFAHTFTVEAGDIDVMGHVNNVVYVRWIQEVAVKHWMAKASAEQIASVLWVVVRHEIDYLRPAFPGEQLTAHTWVGAATAVTYERLTEIVRVRDKVDGKRFVHLLLATILAALEQGRDLLAESEV